MMMEIVCPEDDVCCQDLNQLSVTSRTSDASTLAPRSGHDLRSLLFGLHSDGSESEASFEDWSVAIADEGGVSLEDEEPPWPVAMLDSDDDYDPRDARFIREASEGSIAECRREILGGQIARLDAAVRRRSPREEASPALAHYGAVLRELREESAAAGAARGLGSAASASTAGLGLAPFTMGKECTPRPRIPLPRAPWVVHDALDLSLSGGLLEEALFGGNSPRGALSPRHCRCSRSSSRSRSPPRRASHGAEADDYDVIGSSFYS